MNNRLKYCWLGLLGLVFFAVSCAEPGPLYGTWADSRGNTVSFFDDNTFSAKVSGQNYSGKYTLLLNALTIDCDDIDLRIVTEWDIRGNILYLDWTTADGALSLALFKISN
jgi:hypothetical protein